jgi:hypothetical protein
MLQSQTTGSLGRIRTDPALVRTAVGAIIVAQYGYTFAFIHLPTDVRLAFAGVLLVLQTVLAGVALTTRPSLAGGLIVIAAVMTFLCWGISYGSGFGGSHVVLDLRIMSKDVQLFIAPIWLLAFWDVLRLRSIALLAMGGIVVGGILALTGPPNPFPGEIWNTRFAVITGLVTTVPFSSAFFILLNAFIVDQLRRAGIISPVIAWPLIAFAIVLIIGYQTRTAWVMLAAYYATSLYHRWRHIDFVRALPLVLLGLGAVSVIAFLALSGEDIERLGSGRMASYILRMEILSNRDWGPLLFGSGPDTDKFRTAVWWWEEKDAHNDYLHVSIETGLVGVLALIIFLVALYSKLPAFGKPLFFSLIASSMFSNALLSRPTLSIYLFLAMAVSIRLSWEILPNRSHRTIADQT